MPLHLINCVMFGLILWRTFMLEKEFKDLLKLNTKITEAFKVMAEKMRDERIEDKFIDFHMRTFDERIKTLEEKMNVSNNNQNH